jgi:hypothetical protein
VPDSTDLPTIRQDQPSSALSAALADLVAERFGAPPRSAVLWDDSPVVIAERQRILNDALDGRPLVVVPGAAA